MTKSRLLTVLFIGLSSFLHAQMKDLGQIMNNAELVMYQTILNQDESIYGYIYIYNVDLVNKHEAKFEYLILDKNLNEIARNNFIQPKYSSRTFEKYLDCNKMGDNLLISIGYAYLKAFAASGNYINYLVTTYRTLNLKNNTISEEFYFDDGKFKPIVVKDDNLNKAYKNVDNVFGIFAIDNAEYSGYLIKEQQKNDADQYKIKEIKAYDLEKTPTWSYKFNQGATRTTYNTISGAFWPDETIILTFSKYRNSEFIGRSLVGIDLNTGSKLFEYQVDNKDSKYIHYFTINKYGNSIFLAGTYTSNDYNKFEWDKRLGWFRIELDITGKEVSKIYQRWLNASKFVQIKENGKLEGGYRLVPHEFFIFRDGTSSFLAEKFKEQKGATFFMGSDQSKSSDMVLVNFDRQFDIKSVNVIEKEVSTTLHYDYLFSQYIKNKTGAVFFFEDYKKGSDDDKRKWFLGINKIINGQYSYEEVPITSSKKDFVIIPYIAKEGYIMLREYNESKKYNQIRLEKLNF